MLKIRGKTLLQCKEVLQKALKMELNTVPAGFSDQFSSTRLRSLNPIVVAKPKVLLTMYWLSMDPGFLVAKPKKATQGC